jgi:hypothetical protein
VYSPHCEDPSFVSGTRYIATMLMLGFVVLAWRNADHPLADIVQLKQIRAPRFEARVRPRRPVRTRGSGKHTLQCVDARVLQVVEAPAYGPAEQHRRA